MAANPQVSFPAVDRAEALARHENALRLDELYEREPECTCQQTDVDLFDARGCELHDERSAWNMAYRELTDAQQYYRALEKEESDVCPF